jgi:putative DNA primase/helicase
VSETPNPKPIPLKVLPLGIPEELKELKQWVLWKFWHATIKAPWSKPPRQPDRSAWAHVDKPDTWHDYTSVMGKYQQDHAAGWDGIGFVFSPNDPYCGLDLDKCRDPITGTISDYAWHIIRAFDTYTEVSPTGTGVKLFFRAHRSEGKIYELNLPELKQAEVFSQGKYFTLTGRSIDEPPKKIQERQNVVDQFCDIGFRPQEEQPEEEDLSPNILALLEEAENKIKANNRPPPEERAIAYLQWAAVAISGAGGHNTMFRIARAIVYGLDLGASVGFDLLKVHYNPSCQPPWSDKELHHKCDDADTKPCRKERGYLLNQERDRTTAPKKRPPEESAETVSSDGVFESPDDPHRLARSFRKPAGNDSSCLVPRHWRGEWYDWDGIYRRIEEVDLRARVVEHVKSELDKDYRRRRAKDESAKPAKKVTSGLVTNVLQALASLGNLPSPVSSPSWLAANPGWPEEEILIAPNAIVHLPSLATEQPVTKEPTPSLWTINSIGCHFQASADQPGHWLQFLHDIWPNDQLTIDALQDWFGYCLTSDTSQQKILLLVGPKRSGKGTILRVLRGLVGNDNTVSPTLSSLGGPFGMQPLLGKSLGTITDARLSHRTDLSAVTECLLSISGEDGQTVNRKCLVAVSMARMPIKFVIVTNELPRLADASGAFVGRFVALRQTLSWFGKEDRGLTSRLMAELPSILLWSITGWERLRRNGHFIQPTTSEPLIEQLEELSSPIRAFIQDRCAVGLNEEVPCDEMFAAWQLWCKARGEYEGTSALLGRNLRAAEPSIDTRQGRDGKDRFRKFIGISLLPFPN